MHTAVEKQRPLQGHRHGKRPPRASLRWKWWRCRGRGAPVTLLDGEGGPSATTTGRDKAVSGFSDWRPPLAGLKGAPCHCCRTRGGRLQRAGAVPAPSPPQPTFAFPAAGATCKEACGAPLTRTAAAPTGNATASRRKHPPARGTAVPLANPTGPSPWGVLARLVRFPPLASRGGERTVRRRRGTLCVTPHGRRAHLPLASPPHGCIAPPPPPVPHVPPFPPVPPAPPFLPSLPSLLVSLGTGVDGGVGGLPAAVDRQALAKRPGGGCWWVVALCRLAIVPPSAGASRRCLCLPAALSVLGGPCR